MSINALKNSKLIASVISASFLLSGCVGDSDDSNSTDFSAAETQNMIVNITDNVIIPNLNAAQSAANDLASDTGDLAAYCQAIGTAAEDSTLNSAKQSWANTMDAWQRAQLSFVLPVSDSNNNAELVRKVLAYAENSITPCAIDRRVVIVQNDGFNADQLQNNFRGLDAIDYLLFNTDLDHQCTSTDAETVALMNTWDAQTDTDKKIWRCELALHLAGDISGAVQQFSTQWADDGDNFRSKFINPSNEHLAIEALSDAIFFLDTTLKDIKIGYTLNLAGNCPGTNGLEACPTRVESRFSNRSLENVKTNLEAFLELYKGKDGQGFDDYIIAKGHPDIAQEFIDETQAAIDHIDTIEGTLSDEVARIVTTDDAAACTNAAANPDSPSDFPSCALFGLVKRVTDDLKDRFVAIVEVEIPDRAQSDND